MVHGGVSSEKASSINKIQLVSAQIWCKIKADLLLPKRSVTWLQSSQILKEDIKSIYFRTV